MTIERIVNWANVNPKKLFKIDGYGAVLSANLLGIVLVKLQYLIGIPKPTLYFLALMPCFFAIYDFYCYLTINGNFGSHLKRIAIINLIYCCMSFGLAFYHRDEITSLGWIYILTEIVIVGCLAIVELNVAKNQS